MTKKNTGARWEVTVDGKPARTLPHGLAHWVAVA